MKISRTFSLLALGAMLTTEAVEAQTTPTGAATSTTRPVGAIAPDSTPTNPSRRERQAMKRNRTDKTNTRTVDQNSRMNSSGSTSSQDGQYRQSSASGGTSVNNSNVTNYNSNNATNAPTGAGSNPTTSGSSATSPTPADQVSNGQNNSAARGSVSSEGGSYSPNTGATPSGTSVSTSGSGSETTKTGTAGAVSGARTTTTPAITAGSTARNTSIGDFVSSSPNYTTLQNALQSADLSETLKGTGPYTVFAPSNSAFKKLPAAAQSGLLDGSNQQALKQLLSYHVVQGLVDATELSRRIKAGNGKARLQTLSGGTLTAQAGADGHVMITDGQGNTATVDAADNRQTNGVVHGIDTVLMPK